jgi:hypothetical protein
MYDIAKLLHLISAIVWMGGMTFMLFALRPSVTALMEPQPRAQLMAEVWRRFFAIVAIAVVVLFATGTHMYTAAFKAAKAAGGGGSVPRNRRTDDSDFRAHLLRRFSKIQTRRGRCRVACGSQSGRADSEFGDGQLCSGLACDTGSAFGALICRFNSQNGL